MRMPTPEAMLSLTHQAHKPHTTVEPVPWQANKLEAMQIAREFKAEGIRQEQAREAAR